VDAAAVRSLRRQRFSADASRCFNDGGRAVAGFKRTRGDLDGAEQLRALPVGASFERLLDRRFCPCRLLNPHCYFELIVLPPYLYAPSACGATQSPLRRLLELGCDRERHVEMWYRGAERPGRSRCGSGPQLASTKWSDPGRANGFPLHRGSGAGERFGGDEGQVLTGADPSGGER
jgi:hypothetical protein